MGQKIKLLTITRMLQEKSGDRIGYYPKQITDDYLVIYYERMKQPEKENMLKKKVVSKKEVQ
ncbi:hypothetical protein GI584_01810 [Gracilibacillus salitolerans]|uniref:Uncharacterized protein n=1 Tax=Gracilibacillus salitolerans TaxID=2663022 RepID=A0A5Q2TFT5_9BACI|nr:hypothetical protein [Gracilibacillus salitolerans]QGH32863.1 hypothetical protein GI584_01810 [Gracilibacillus salitolerans]